MDPMVAMAAGSVIVGFAVGILAGLLGVGGGTLLVPIFKLGYAMSSIMCTATSLFTIIPTSVSGAISHFRNRTCISKLGIAAGLGGAVMSPVGVWLASVSPDWAIMGAAAVIIAYSAVTMFRKALAAPKRPADAQQASTPKGGDAEVPTAAQKRDSLETAAQAAAALGWRELAIGAAIGLVAGIASGYVGVGGGFIMVPMMMQIIRIPMRLTSGTSLIAVMILAVPGVITQALMGNINWVAGIAVACGSIPGVLLGARLVSRVPERTLRFLFSGFLVLAAVLLVVNELGLWG